MCATDIAQIGFSKCLPGGRVCEYDESEIEYWVNTRTMGTLSREDMQRLSISQSHEGEGDATLPPEMTMHDGGFEDVGGTGGSLEVEGDSSLQATKLNHLATARTHMQI